MKTIKLFVMLLAILVTSCASVRVTSDYDTQADFNTYKTFAFYKTGIDKAEISDLDKKRILRAIETQMISKEFNDKKELMYHSSNVYQKRNPHILMKDFKDEVPVYIQTESINLALKNIKLKKGMKNYLSNMVTCYDQLCKKEFFPKKEMILVKAWEKDILKLTKST